MLSALLFLQYHSFRNRLAVRLKRLRQPKYLAGAIVGLLYFYFYLFRYVFGMRRGTNLHPFDVAPGFYETIGAFIFFLFILAAWVLPRERAALAFTEAEVAFLFPAPISRRGLIHFKLIRSQTAILFTTFFMVLVFRRFGGNVWIHAAGWWVILSMLNLHLLGASFARTMLLDRGITNAWRRAIILLLALAFAVGTFVWAFRTVPQADVANLDNFGKIQAYVQSIFASGPLPWLLYPFRLVVRPYLAADAISFLKAVAPAFCLLLLHYAWVARSDVAFEEASLEASKRLADRVAAIRAGNWRRAGKKAKARRAPFQLVPTGKPWVALLWKNLISAGQVVSARIWLLLAIFVVAVAVELRQQSGQSAVVPSIGMVGIMALVWSMIAGPQVARQDFRQDLPMADVLKLYPLRGWQIAIGEIAAPATILTVIQWFLVVLIAAFFPAGRHLGPGIILGSAFGLAIILPLWNVISLLIPNAAVLMFPAWFHTGRGGVQGFEATGQRLIFALGQLVVLSVALVPAAIAFALVFIPLNMFTGMLALAIPLGALAAAAVLAGEAALGFRLLGRLFERLDFSAEVSA